VFLTHGFFPQIERTVFQWTFAPKWFRNGGRNFTLVFTGTAATTPGTPSTVQFATQ
jgi:hypothetical protein